MSKDRDVRPAAPGGPTGSRNDTRPAARRRLLTTLGAGAAASAALPTRWTKPIADSVLLPAHAQTSSVEPPPTSPVEPPLPCVGFAVTLRWCGGGRILGLDPRDHTLADCPGLPAVDNPTLLLVREPGGMEVGPDTQVGTVLLHTGDAGGGTGSQAITVRPGLDPFNDNQDFNDYVGTYVVRVGYGDAIQEVTIEGCDGSRYRVSFFNGFSSNLVNVARVHVGSAGDLSIEPISLPF